MLIDSIRPYASNPRDNDGAVDAVANSLKEFGFRQPIVVDADGVIIVGHTRYKAALKLNLKQMPVHVATDLTPAQVKAYRLADNATNEPEFWISEEKGGLLPKWLLCTATPTARRPRWILPHSMWTWTTSGNPFVNPTNND